MIIEFKKYRNKPSVLKCIRDDGSESWVSMYPGIEAHDLGHYAIETILDFEDAFYGMVARGTNITDFELPRNKRPQEVLPQNLSTQALVTEHLVNLLLVKAQSNEDLDFLEMARSILAEKQLPFPKNLDHEHSGTIWAEFQRLCQLWKTLPVGNTLSLCF